MINDILSESKKRMAKSIESLRTELSKFRTGRATPSLLDHVMIDYYGTPTPLKQIANITVEDARTLAVSPWEKPMVPVIEKAILTADLGLNPATSGSLIRIPMPPLTEDRRKELVKLVREEGEKTRVAVRNIRRDANNDVKELLKEKDITEDEAKKAEADVQKITDQFIGDVDAILHDKEKDLMTV